MHVIDGKQIAGEMRAALKEEITKSGLLPGLGVVLVGTREESVKYVMSKERAAVEVGIRFKTLQLATEATREEIIHAVKKLANDTNIHGIIVQLPLPNPADTEEVIAAIPYAKDADGMTPETREHLESKLFDIVPVPCRVILRCLQDAGCDASGKRMAMVVKSAELYSAFATIMQAYGAETVRIHPDDPELAHKLREMDVIASLPGRPGLITADMVKPGAVVIDYDYPLPSVDFDRVKEVAGAITPVPGGCGPMTVAYLLRNTFELCQKADQK